MPQSDRMTPQMLPASGLFVPGVPVHIARAPGRLDVMGGIADYSGATVLEMPLACAAWAAVQRRSDARIVLASESLADGSRWQADFTLADWLDDYEAVRARVAGGPDRWTAYVAGAFPVLARERGAGYSTGATILIRSDVPVGAGVSSSAALEVASMKAISAAYGIPLDGLELACLCQMVENRIAGAPCGLMDQVTSALGRAGHLLALRCQPATVLGHDPVPAGWRFVALDSGVKHSVGGRAYARARVAAFMGWRMMRAIDPAWPPDGYLANLSEAEVRHRLGADFLPASLSGRAFLARYPDWPDPVTTVDPAQDYPVRIATLHPILENAGVERVRSILASGSAATPLSARAAEEIGEWLYRSHERYSALHLGCPETDLIVRLVKQRGPAGGLFGARITGGGCGGSVVILAEDTAAAARSLTTLQEAYRTTTGHPARLIEGSSDGAEITGTQAWTP